jgi:hypothetical protein
VTGWGTIRSEGEGCGKRVGNKGKKKLMEREAVGFSTGEEGRVIGETVGMRG